MAREGYLIIDSDLHMMEPRDHPHSDGAFPGAIRQFLGLSFDDEQRRKILWDNCARLYAIPRPAAPLTREHDTASAA